MTYTLNTYSRLPVAFSHGKGVWLWDTQGGRYLDALSGIAVNTLGHAHPKLTQALQDQVGRLIHTSNYYVVPEQEALAKALVDRSGLSKAFFCSTGLEANEAALKLARKWGHQRGIAKPKVVVYERGFHGRSMATLSATGNPKVHHGFEPLMEGFIRVPLNDIEALKRVTEYDPDVAAVFLETIQGEGGIHSAREAYLKEVRALCDQREWLLMLDEVQCGMARTGRWFAHQWLDVKPDVMSLAKGLGSGVPVGAMVVSERASHIFEPGNHGTTFGGNPLAMTAGLKTVELIESEGLLENATQMGALLQKGLAGLRTSFSCIHEVRGQGLMVGVELDRPCAGLLYDALAEHLLVSVTAERVVRFLPALIVNEAEIGEIIERFSRTLARFVERI